MRSAQTMILPLIIAVFGAASTSSGVVWDQLADEEHDITVIPPFDTSGEPVLYADDFDTEGSTYEYTGLTFHFAHKENSLDYGAFHIEVYEDDFVSMPIHQETFDPGEYIFGPTGWAFTDGSLIDWLTVWFDSGIALNAGHIYWTTFNMEHEDEVFICAQDHELINFDVLQEDFGSGWGPYGDYDASMKWHGGSTAIELVTLGQIKAAFK